MTLAEQKAVVAHTSEAFSDTEPNVVTEAAKAVLKDSEARGGGVLHVDVSAQVHGYAVTLVQRAQQGSVGDDKAVGEQARVRQQVLMADGDDLRAVG